LVHGRDILSKKEFEFGLGRSGGWLIVRTRKAEMKIRKKGEGGDGRGHGHANVHKKGEITSRVSQDYRKNYTIASWIGVARNEGNGRHPKHKYQNRRGLVRKKEA